MNALLKDGGDDPGADAIQVMTMKVSKGLEFSIMAPPSVGPMPAAGEDEKEAAQVFYEVATRATHRLVTGAVGTGSSESCFFSCDSFRPSMIQMQRC